MYQRRLRQANALDFDDLIMTTVNLLQPSPTSPSTTGGGSGTSSSMSTRTPTTRSTSSSESWSAAGGSSRPPGDGPVPPPSSSSSATPTSRSTPSAGRASATSSSSSGLPRRRTILLEQNYRSTQTILTGRQRGHRATTRARPKKPVDRRGRRRADRRLCRRQRARRGRRSSRNEIDRLTDEHGVKPKDVAVFYRTNAQSRPSRRSSSASGCPTRWSAGTRFYERREIRDASPTCGCIANPDRRRLLRRILNVPKRGIGDRAEACVGPARRAGAHPLRRRAGRAAEAPGIATRSVARSGFTSLLERPAHRRRGGSRRGDGCSRRCSSRAATSPSCAPVPTRRTRPGWRTSPSSSLRRQEFDETRMETGEVTLVGRLPRAGLARRGRRRDPGRRGTAAASSR
jgi:DNA helicase-2/ATP-dependent DNA helicase PcrA